MGQRVNELKRRSWSETELRIMKFLAGFKAGMIFRRFRWTLWWKFVQKKKGTIFFGEWCNYERPLKNISLSSFLTQHSQTRQPIGPPPRKSRSKSQIHQGERNSIVCSPPQKWCFFVSKWRELPWKSQINLGGLSYQSLLKWMVYSHMIGDGKKSGNASIVISRAEGGFHNFETFLL